MYQVSAQRNRDGAICHFVKCTSTERINKKAEFNINAVLHRIIQHRWIQLKVHLISMLLLN